MDVSKQKEGSYQENKRFLSQSYKLKEDFLKKYTKFYYGQIMAEKLYLQILTGLERAILDGNFDTFKKLSSFICYISNIEDLVTLRAYYDNVGNPIKNTNLVILACKHNQVGILKYLFTNQSEILNKLTIDIGRIAILPEDTDGTCHNAFYYAIRTSNVELINTLINNYFITNSEELTNILAIAYSELKLKNVPLTDEIAIFVESKLMNLRFYSNNAGQVRDVATYLSNIKERIGLVLDNIRLINSNIEEIDEIFIFIAKFVAHNIHILKRQLKSTYDRLPWEEIEFCLIIFVSSHIKQHKMNLFCDAVLDKRKILKYLESFAKVLEDERNNIDSVDISKLAALPKLNRDKVIAKIIGNCPEFEELYNDYQQIRDIHSLDKISNYIQLALSADPKEREEQLIIIRAIQVIGEYFKNTLESPKLSNIISELLVMSLPKNTRKVIIDLRNSLSHANSLSQLTEIGENADINFFINIQTDIIKINSIITDMLYKYKIEIIRILLTKVIDSESLDEIREVAKSVSNVELDKTILRNDAIMEHENIEKLIKKLNDIITEKTSYEDELFNKINKIIDLEKNKLASVETVYNVILGTLLSLSYVLSNIKIDKNFIGFIKNAFNLILENITLKIKSEKLKEIAELSLQINNSIRIRLQEDKLIEVQILICKIIYFVRFGIDNIKWIEELQEKCNQSCFIVKHKHKKMYKATAEKYNKQLTLKLTVLKNILSNNSLIQNFSSYRNNKKMQAVVEMLVLDVMSILEDSMNNLENNLQFLDESSPTLTGKSLRNHLAHDNLLLDVLLSDPSIAMILNAEKLTAENIIGSEKKIGLSLTDDPSKLKDKYDRDLAAITNQKELFAALEEGNFEGFKNCLEKGADINARSVNLWTTLHFAAKGSSLEVIKFIVDQNVGINVSNGNCQSPLHIAAAYGRNASILEFLMGGLESIDNVDDNGDTPLHLAAWKGHKDTVVVLLKNKANTITENKRRFSPLYCALTNNHIDVVKILLEQNVDINETKVGYTPLYGAAERGNLELVDFLIQNKANVNAKTDQNSIPLHAAALNGHVEVVNTLILNGSVVNTRNINGCTVLHNAVENGHEKVVDVLLKHGVDVNVADKPYKLTPLHYAAKNGYERIFKTLLKHKADANVATVEGMTPLHFAAQMNRLRIISVLLEHGVEVNGRNKSHFTPLHYAAENGRINCVELLIKNKANVNADNNVYTCTPLHVAAVIGHVEVVNTLILNGSVVNARNINGCTVLHNAVVNGHEMIVDILLKLGVDVNVADKTYKLTPLHYAAKDGYEGIVKSLLKHKADANVATVEGMTPLHFAAQMNHLRIISVLLEQGVDINAKNKSNFTALHDAAANGHLNCVELLIKNKANVNDQDVKGNIPLHMATMNGSKEVVNHLIENEATIDSRNSDGVTPLVIAAMNDKKDVMDLLMKNKANVNAISNSGLTPLYAAIIEGHIDVVRLLIKNDVAVNATCISDCIPLHAAVMAGHKDVVKILIENGANVNAITKDSMTPLSCAVKKKHKELVKVLIGNGAKVNAQDNIALKLAVLPGYRDIVDILLKHNADIKMKYAENITILHFAAGEGHKEIVDALIKKGADVNALAMQNVPPLDVAVEKGHGDIVELLILNGAKINFENSPLHIAAVRGHDNVVKVLLKNGADINGKDCENQTAIQLAVAYDHIEVVKTLLQHKDVNINVKNIDNLTILHIAAKKGNLGIIRCLVKKGADINARNSSGVKPIHLAARDGHINIIDFFVDKGLSINETGINNQTLLHYAAIKDQTEVAEYLINKDVDLNSKDTNGSTPLHIAAFHDHTNFMKVLLKNGAIYNSTNKFTRKPLKMSINNEIIDLLTSIENLFKAVKLNNILEVKNCIQAGAIVNAKNCDGVTPLHFAAWKGYDEVVDVLLQNHADINAIGDKKLTPLHYATKFSHLKIVKALLSNGALYNPVSINRKTPLDFGVDINITNLFKLVGESFKNVQNGDCKVINDLKTIEDIDTVKAIMNARNTENKTLVVTAIHNNFPNVEQLKQIFQDDLSAHLNMVDLLLQQENYQEVLNIFRMVLEKRRTILGPDNPGTWDIQGEMAKILYKQHKYKEAISLFEDIYQKQKEILGTNHEDTLNIKSLIALVLYRQGKYEKSFEIYEDVYKKQIDILGTNNSDVLATQMHMALVLDKQKKYDEALRVNYEVLKKVKKSLGANHPSTLSTQNNIAMVLNNQGKFKEAFKMYRKVYEARKIILGPTHSDTLRVLHNKLGVLVYQNRYYEALEGYKEVFNTQKVVLGPNNIDTLNTQTNIANLFFSQDKFIGAFKNYKKSLDPRKAILGSNHPDILDTERKLEIIDLEFKLMGENASNLLQYLQKDINKAANDGDVQAVQYLLNNGADVNDTDVDGRTPLHFASSKGHLNVVKMLLQNKADVTQISNKGNTPLHIATSKGYNEIVEVLLEHIANCDTINNFINAQTTAGGTTSLHVAAKNGFLKIVKLLLIYGATYDIKNTERKTPLNVCINQIIINFLTLIEDLFTMTKNGTLVIEKLKLLKSDELIAFTNAHNNEGNTLLEVSIINKHTNVARQLLELLKPSKIINGTKNVDEWIL